ncbi:DUF4259 domain-containing protein, partial [Streptomyces hundungensis]|uniref:DUF4259 domain-containing protein n=1 Tax=Streptomyces hundungensis TaxID=1077946 RepID=UPI0034102458
HFDNDTAADFSHTLDEATEAERESILRHALLSAIDTQGYLDSDIAAEAIAAAALVATQYPGGQPITTAYGPKHPLPQLSPDLRDLAIRALDRAVTKPSELLELWGEADRNGPWREGMRQLRDVLTHTGRRNPPSSLHGT